MTQWVLTSYLVNVSIPKTKKDLRSSMPFKKNQNLLVGNEITETNTSFYSQEAAILINSLNMPKK